MKLEHAALPVECDTISDPHTQYAFEQGDASVPHIYVVIPVRDRRAFTDACLASLAAQTIAHTVVVVDDGSSDGTPDMIERDYPGTILLRGDGELWWAGATNTGVGWTLAHCSPDDWVVTLNDDTLLSESYLEDLTRPAAITPRALIGSVAVDETDPETIIDGGVRIDWWRAKFRLMHRGETLREAYPNGGLHAADVLSGCGTLVPVQAYRELGPCNARQLPHYGADYEFTRRADRAGYRVLVNAGAVVQRRRSTGIHAEVGHGGFGALVRSFVSRRSSTNLAARVNFALLAAPRSLLLPYLFCDLGRVFAWSLRRHRDGGLTPS